MDPATLFLMIGKATAAIVPLAGAIWAIRKWLKKEELFPRIVFNIDAEVIGEQDNKIILDIIATIENKGMVPLKIKEFNYELTGIKRDESLTKNHSDVQHQLDFPHKLDSGSFLLDTWKHSFVQQDVSVHYNQITFIPNTISYILIRGAFKYIDTNKNHYANHIIKIPAPNSKHLDSELAELKTA